MGEVEKKKLENSLVYRVPKLKTIYQDSFPLSIIENMKQKGRHGERNPYLLMRNKGGKAIENDIQK